MSNISQGGGKGGKNPQSIEALPTPYIAPLPTPKIDEELEKQYDEPPSLLDEPEIEPKCLSDFENVIKDGIGKYPKSAAMQKTAPENLLYLYADAWENLPNDDNRYVAAMAAVEEEIKNRE